MLSLKARLLAAEDDFLSALVEGDNAVLDFNQRWETLVEEVNGAYDSARADPELLALAHVTALRVATLADASIEVFETSDNVASILVSQLDSLMSELTLTDDHPPPALLPDSDSLIDVSAIGSHASRSSGRKRHRSDMEDLHESVTSFRKSKRVHSNSSSPTTTPLGRPLSSSPANAPRTEDMQQTLTTPSPRPRKRCLSDADSSLRSNPRKRFHVGPRLHAVSESFAYRPPQSRSSSPLFSPSETLLSDPVTYLDSSIPLELSTFDGLSDPCKLISDFDDQQTTCVIDELWPSLYDSNHSSIMFPMVSTFPSDGTLSSDFLLAESATGTWSSEPILRSFSPVLRCSPNGSEDRRVTYTAAGPPFAVLGAPMKTVDSLSRSSTPSTSGVSLPATPPQSSAFEHDITLFGLHSPNAHELPGRHSFSFGGEDSESSHLVCTAASVLTPDGHDCQPKIASTDWTLFLDSFLPYHSLSWIPTPASSSLLSEVLHPSPDDECTSAVGCLSSTCIPTIAIY